MLSTKNLKTMSISFIQYSNLEIFNPKSLQQIYHIANGKGNISGKVQLVVIFLARRIIIKNQLALLSWLGTRKINIQ